MSDEAAIAVQLETTYGVLSIEVYSDALTCGASSSFLRLAVSGQLEGRLFSSLVPGLCIVGVARGADEGQVLGIPWSGSCGYSHSDDGQQALRHVGAGLLTCRLCDGVVPASTFLITLAPQPKLDGVYTVFGRVSSGIGVVERMSKAQCDDHFQLFTPVDVRRCVVVQKPRVTRPVVRVDQPGRSAESRRADGR